jgi:cystathionine beta-synthase
MADQGLVEQASTGDLRDLITRKHARGEVTTLKPADTLQRAYQQMKANDVSQLPVTTGEHILGILDESDVLMAVMENPAAWQDSVQARMSRQLVTVAPSAGVKELMAVFDAGRVAIVVEGGKFLGLITRIDLLQHLRRRALG